VFLGTEVIIAAALLSMIRAAIHFVVMAVYHCRNVRICHLSARITSSSRRYDNDNPSPQLLLPVGYVVDCGYFNKKISAITVDRIIWLIISSSAAPQKLMN